MAAAAGVIFQPQNNDDNFVHITNPNDIIKLLAHHWSAVFAKKQGNKFLSKSLLKGYTEHVVWNWNLSRPPDSSTIDAAIMNSKNSSPGVDNIGNLVWKFGPPQFRSYLYSCLDSHLSGAPAPMHFNDGLWAFLPKGEQEDDGSTGPGFVERMPSETRPLTMKNTDNKIIAAAVTYASIPTFKDTVNSTQQGFVPELCGKCCAT